MPPAPIHLEHLTWPSIQSLQAKSPRMRLLPTGATEQHGPHLPIHTDSLIATRVCEEASARTNVPLLPTLRYTQSTGHTTKWPGTFSLSHQTFIETVVEIATWAVNTGWERLLLVNSHFGNDAVLRIAVDRIRVALLGRFQIGLLHTFQLTSAIWDYFISDGDDVHANRAETDLLLHLAPELVDQSALQDDPDRTSGTVFSYPVAQTSRNGLTGTPSLGTAEQGKELFQEMVDALTAKVEIAKIESPPLEHSAWEPLVSVNQSS
ncbi:MAG: creatininase family protein [Verrucomicrobiota bacterium]